MISEWGLRLREKPEQSSKEVAVLPDGAMVRLVAQKPEQLRIDTLPGKWTKVRWKPTGKDEVEGWAFGGYLSQYPLPSKGCKSAMVFLEKTFETKFKRSEENKGPGVLAWRHYWVFQNGFTLSRSVHHEGYQDTFNGSSNHNAYYFFRLFRTCGEDFPVIKKLQYPFAVEKEVKYSGHYSYRIKNGPPIEVGHYVHLSILINKDYTFTIGYGDAA